MKPKMPNLKETQIVSRNTIDEDRNCWGAKMVNSNSRRQGSLLKRIRQLSFITSSLAMAFLLPSLFSEAYASTNNSHGQVRAEINGKPVLAIAVGDTTYLEWDALQIFHTPNEYLGDGKFAITGGTIQGVVYHGNTYLPWNVVAPKVKATPLRGGGFNFTSLPVQHQYHILIGTQDGVVGRPAPFEVLAADGDQWVPHQSIQVRLSGRSYVSGYSHVNPISVVTDKDGLWVGGMNDTTAEKVQAVVTWTDPSGHVQTRTENITFASASSTQTPVPSDDTVVATVPLTPTFDNALLFNAQAGGNDILFQLDTGAYEPLVTQQVAELLHLPNLGSTQVQGVGGQDEAYNSEITLSIGGVEFNNVPCIVDKNFTGPSLFGYGFFADNGYDLLVSQKHDTMTILK
jgi:hypothetical protein